MARRDRATQVSKLLALHLRHAPQRIGIRLDAEGFVAVDVLLERAAAHGFAVSRQELDAAVHAPGKRRYELDPEGGRVRAVHGHSVTVDLGYAPVAPPAALYHGTVARSLDAIFELGLLPMRRRHVHLSETLQQAREVAARRGAPVILAVDARAMHEAGIPFYRSASGVWLVDRVPVGYIQVTACSDESGRRRA
jgi:putative RNA 2'-phosphotransferase